jgi:uncharacterized protein DUF5681
MPNNADDAGYNVGFGKPPQHTRFRKGRSGNPKGRPKGRRNLATVLERTLQEKVVINENGVRRTVTKLEAAVKQLVNKAAAGDLAALRQLTALAAPVEEQDADVANNQLSEVDIEVMQGVLQRLQGCVKEESDEN